jgi:hypothetical protein
MAIKSSVMFPRRLACVVRLDEMSRSPLAQSLPQLISEVTDNVPAGLSRLSSPSRFMRHRHPSEATSFSWRANALGKLGPAKQGFSDDPQ